LSQFFLEKLGTPSDRGYMWVCCFIRDCGVE
jgi:hypothetical protein